MSISSLVIKGSVQRSLLEDLGHGTDITSALMIPGELRATAVMRARKPGIICGIDCAKEAFLLTDSASSVKLLVEDGRPVEAGDDIMTITACARPILTAERTALNYITMMSGIATMTAAYVKETEGTSTKIACTRKTLPGLRPFQKHAVVCGGGISHRHGLDDAILIKDNHIALSGSIKAALEMARRGAGHMRKIEIEVDTLPQLQEVIDCGIADCVLLDNMSIEEMKKAVEMVTGHKIITEASGNVSIGSIREIAMTGIDIISSGALTHSFTSLDIGLDIDFHTDG